MTALWDQVWPGGHVLPCMLPVASHVDSCDLVVLMFWIWSWPLEPCRACTGARDLLCSLPQAVIHTLLPCAWPVYKSAGAFQDNCYKLEMFTMLRICMVGTDLSFVTLSWWHMRSYLNLILLIYERTGCKFDYFPWGFSESNAFPALFLSEGALPVACKDHLTFRAFVGHACITVLVGNNTCVGYLRKTIALLCRKFKKLSLSIFIREIFALN